MAVSPPHSVAGDATLRTAYFSDDRWVLVYAIAPLDWENREDFDVSILACSDGSEAKKLNQMRIQKSRFTSSWWLDKSRGNVCREDFLFLPAMLWRGDELVRVERTQENAVNYDAYLTVDSDRLRPTYRIGETFFVGDRRIRREGEFLSEENRGKIHLVGRGHSLHHLSSDGTEGLIVFNPYWEYARVDGSFRRVGDPGLLDRIRWLADREYQGFFKGEESGFWHAATLPLLLLSPLLGILGVVLLKLARRSMDPWKWARWLGGMYLGLSALLAYYFWQGTGYL